MLITQIVVKKCKFFNNYLLKFYCFLTRTMKIGFISLMRIAPWGGSEELWSKTALLAISQGHAVETLTNGWVPNSSRIEQLQKAGAVTKFYHDDSKTLLDRTAIKLGFKTPKSELIPTLDADIFVISNGSIWDFTLFKVITDKIIATRKPYILLIHNTLESGHNLNDLDRSYALEILAKAARRLFVSERNRKGTERQLAASVEPYQVVGNPVSIREPLFKPFPISDTLLLACVGSLTCYSKGQDILLEALSGELWKNRDFYLKIYGAGPDETYLRHLIAFYKLQDKVTLEGHVSDVDHIWETSQVLVLSSVFEGVPMVVAEAMLKGRPVLGTDVGGVERYVIEGETGFLVAAAKAKYLAQGLEKLWDNRASLKRMGEKAFQQAVAITDLHPTQSFLAIIESSLESDSR